MLDKNFKIIADMIQSAKSKTFAAVNRDIIDLYWEIGKFISSKVASEKWGKGVVVQLAKFIEESTLSEGGFSAQNLWRMRQFYETYSSNEKLSPLVRELTWTNNLIILSRCKTDKEREFYLNLARNERYSKRELDRQINTGIYERTQIGNQKLSESVKKLPQNVYNKFRDSYVLEFLNLPDEHKEKDLQKELLKQLKKFILELGKDYILVGDNYRIQVGNTDFYIDILFYHRELQCLIAIELKIDKFKPEFLGQLNFYLEALDRDVKKHHENPSVGILLCKDKDDEVVEYALSRNISPTVVAEYQMKLIDKKLLKEKFHQLFIDSENEKVEK